MGEELYSLLIWYATLLLIGWGSFPIVFTLFEHFPDRGFSFSKTLGLLLTTYFVWMASSLGFTQYHRTACFVSAAGFFAANGVLTLFNRKQIWKYIRTDWRVIFGLEGLFLLFFLGAVLIRIYTPDLTGAEKEADFTLLNAILHSNTFPPKDTWFAGSPINYYYFGYTIWATLIKLSGVIAPIGFNLALATIVALAVSNSFGLVYRLTQRVSYSLFAAFLLMIFGNLDGLIQILQRGDALFPYDWWRSSRVIPDTINEFPYFSFLLGDLHAHFMSIPFVLLLLGLLRQFAGTCHPKSSNASLVPLVLCLVVSLGGTAVINNWDYPTVLLISAGCLFLAFHNPLWKDVVPSRRLFYGIGLFALLTGLSYAFFLPFYAHFTPQVTLKNLRLVSAVQRTELRYFLIIYGLFLWTLGPVLLKNIFNLRSSSLARQPLVIRVNSVLLGLVLLYVCQSERVLLLSAAMSLFFLYTLYRDASESANASFAWGLLLMAFAIVAGCEMFYIKDFYGHPLERQNTIFKFYYQAWIFLALGIPYALYDGACEALRMSKILKFLWKFAFILFCAACCCYPILATCEKTNRFRGATQGGLPYLPTLNGITYIAYREPDEYAALMWIQEHLEQDTVILEATGRPYSFFGRVATTTGRSTVLGWGNHEALWRDQTWQTIMQRTQDIQAIYETLDKNMIMELLHQYQVEYIYVGKLERESYDSRGLEEFQPMFPRVYENGSVKIYAAPF
ncbi:conserved protein [Candidatus Vecturithrix granuli]|uniref:Conserved protein n=1 Tax=Vecturithrix granuli TaxID=1499967 RepID=A0A081C1Y4_VECG1|nr:conserved protein [Candidatus Vecturithrix granuli]